MQTVPLCRCICGVGKQTPLDGHETFSTDLDTSWEDIEGQEEPDSEGLLAYSVLTNQALRGAPIRTGELFYLASDERVEQVNLSLHVNGLSFVHDDHEISVSLPPLSLVRNCRFQSSRTSLNLSDFKIFKLSFFTQDLSYYFGVRGADAFRAEEERQS